jgi:D-aminopeptidase
MATSQGKTLRIRDLGYAPGAIPTGPTNSILDVPGVAISQVTVSTSETLEHGSTATKGLTVLHPRGAKNFTTPSYAGRHTFNGNGELTGSGQVADWGFINMPIALCNSLSLGTVIDGCWDWVQDEQDRQGMDSMTRARTYGTPIVGETADWYVNSDTRQSRLDRSDIASAFSGAKSVDEGGMVQEGQYGGGAGMTCHQFTGGTGTASRVIKGDDASGQEYVLGVLCQTNYGHLIDFHVGGIPVGKILMKERAGRSAISDQTKIAGRTKDGSIVVVIVTDAPLLPHQLNCVARHATAGLAYVGGHSIGSTHSGDIFLAVSVADHATQMLTGGAKLAQVAVTQTRSIEAVKNESMGAYYTATAEATEEAILNSLVGGRDGTRSMDGTEIDGLPVNRVRELLEQYLVKL